MKLIREVLREVRMPREEAVKLHKRLRSLFPERKWATGRCVSLAFAIHRYLKDRGIDSRVMIDKTGNHGWCQVGTHKFDADTYGLLSQYTDASRPVNVTDWSPDEIDEAYEIWWNGDHEDEAYGLLTGSTTEKWSTSINTLTESSPMGKYQEVLLDALEPFGVLPSGVRWDESWLEKGGLILFLPFGSYDEKAVSRRVKKAMMDAFGDKVQVQVYSREDVGYTRIWVSGLKSAIPQDTFELGKVYPSTVELVKRLFKDGGETWDGKLYRAGARRPGVRGKKGGVYFHTSRDGASFYGDDVEVYGCPEGPCAYIETDQIETDDDIAIAIEKMAPKLFRKHPDAVAIVVYGDTGPHVIGFPVEVILRS